MATTKKKSTQSPSPALVITQKEAERLTPNQAAFNRLTARIEKLRADVERKEKQLDRALKLYGETLPPLEAQLAQVRRDILLTIMPLYEEQKLSKTLQPQLKMMLQDLLQQVIQAGSAAPDAELKALFEKLEGENYDAVADREMREMLKEEFEHLDLKDTWPEDKPFSEQDVEEQFRRLNEEKMERMAAEKQKWEERRKSHSGNTGQAKRLQQEREIKEARQKNITTLYRQLAKILHPDLEQEEERRTEKEGFMKELTEAYESNNLHKLLLLELKWIHGERGHLEHLTEEKLKAYIEILQQQAKEIESSKYQILHQPRYYALVERYGFRPLTYPEKTVREDIKFTQSTILEMQETFESLQTPEAVQHLKQILALRKKEQKRMRMMDTDILEIIFGR